MSASPNLDGESPQRSAGHPQNVVHHYSNGCEDRSLQIDPRTIRGLRGSVVISLRELPLRCCGHYEFRSRSQAPWPTACHRFQSGIEPYAFRSVDVMISENGPFPTTKRMKRHRNRDRHVDSYHSNFYLLNECPCCRAITSKYRRP